MKTNKKNFFLGVLLTGVLFISVGFAAKQLLGPTSNTVAGAVAVFSGTDAFKITNFGVRVTSPNSILYGRSIPTTKDLGTVTGAGTATLSDTNSQYRVIFSGATATIALPGSPSDGSFVIHGKTTYNGGTQVITVPSLIRPEYNPSSAITTFTNASSAAGEFTVSFTAIGGSFIKFSVVGDAYQ